MFAARWRAPLIVGVGLAVFQQLTGVNAVIYYSDKIFAAAGFSVCGAFGAYPADDANSVFMEKQLA